MEEGPRAGRAVSWVRFLLTREGASENVGALRSLLVLPDQRFPTFSHVGTPFQPMSVHWTPCVKQLFLNADAVSSACLRVQRWKRGHELGKESDRTERANHRFHFTVFVTLNIDNDKCLNMKFKKKLLEKKHDERQCTYFSSVNN